MTRTQTTPVPDPETIGADELLDMELPPVRMVVGDVLPAGLVLLAGDPKVGKSLLVQDLAISIAQSDEAWGAYPADDGQVLYINNEGGKHAFKARLEKMTGRRDGLQRLRTCETYEPLGGRLETQIGRWLEKHSDVETRLVVLDTFASCAPEGRGVDRRQDDYNALSGLAHLATDHPDTLFLVVHHTRKNDSDDVMQKISGSQGLTAATDGNAVMVRHAAARQAILSIRPRNAEESEMVLELDPSTLRWRVVGTDERARLSDGRQRILNWLEENPKGGSPQEISLGTGIKALNVRQFLTQMKDARQVLSPVRGRYVAATADCDASVSKG